MKLFPKRVIMHDALKAKRKFAVTFSEMAKNDELRLVKTETVKKEIGGDNVAFWDELDGDSWFVLVTPSDSEFPNVPRKWRYEIQGSGKTALEALADYVVTANWEEGTMPSDKLPLETSDEVRLLTAIFADGAQNDAEKAEILKWFKEVITDRQIKEWGLLGETD